MEMAVSYQFLADFPFSSMKVSAKLTESMKHRIVGTGRHLWRSSSPTPWESTFPTVGSTGKCLCRFWISPEKETPQPLRAVKTCFSHTLMELPVFQFVLAAPSFAGHFWKGPGPMHLTPTIHISIGKSPPWPSPVQAELSQGSQPKTQKIWANAN